MKLDSVARALVLNDLKEMVAALTSGLFRVDQLNEHSSLFSAEVGLCSIDGIELLSKIEQRYGITISLEAIGDNEHTLGGIADVVVDQIDHRA